MQMSWSLNTEQRILQVQNVGNLLASVTVIKQVITRNVAARQVIAGVMQQIYCAKDFQKSME